MSLVLTTFDGGFLRKALNRREAFEVIQLTKFPLLNLENYDAHELIFVVTDEGRLLELDATERAFLQQQLSHLAANKLIALILIPPPSEIAVAYMGHGREWIEDLNSTKCKVLNGADLIRLLGPNAVFDPTYYYHTGSPYSHAFINILAQWILDLERFRTGRQKKLLIIDLDQTLWPGILSEDGFSQIEAGLRSPEGGAFLDCQSEILKAIQLGYMTAICSRNHHDLVAKMFENSSILKITPHNFATVSVSWDSKDQQVAKILSRLSIHARDTIFIDDDPHERDLVRSAFPEIETPKLPDLIYERPLFLRRLIGIANPFASPVDQNRNRNYVTNQLRAEALSPSLSQKAWLQGLRAEFKTVENDASHFERTLQLMNKTNQLNFHPRQRSLSDLQKQIDNQNFELVLLRYQDRLGDDGIVAILVLERREGDLYVHDFILSCRVFGRGLEDSMLHFVLRFARTHGCRDIYFQTYFSKRNAVAVEFAKRIRLLPVDEHTHKIDPAEAFPEPSLIINDRLV